MLSAKGTITNNTGRLFTHNRTRVIKSAVPRLTLSGVVVEAGSFIFLFKLFNHFLDIFLRGTVRALAINGVVFRQELPKKDVQEYHHH